MSVERLARPVALLVGAGVAIVGAWPHIVRRRPDRMSP
jgi:hypothetical protein